MIEYLNNLHKLKITTEKYRKCLSMINLNLKKHLSPRRSMNYDQFEEQAYFESLNLFRRKSCQGVCCGGELKDNIKRMDQCAIELLKMSFKKKIKERVLASQNEINSRILMRKNLERFKTKDDSP